MAEAPVPAADQVLDCTGMACPLPVVKTSQAIKKIEPGRVLELLATDPGYLFGTPGQERFWFLWKELSAGALGAVVLADTRRLDGCFGALDFFESRSIPFIVAVSCFDGADIYDENEVRQALDIGAHVPVQHCDARDRGSGKQVLVRLLEYLVAHATASILVGPR